MFVIHKHNNNYITTNFLGIIGITKLSFFVSFCSHTIISVKNEWLRHHNTLGYLPELSNYTHICITRIQLLTGYL